MCDDASSQAHLDFEKLALAPDTSQKTCSWLITLWISAADEQITVTSSAQANTIIFVPAIGIPHMVLSFSISLSIGPRRSAYSTRNMGTLL